VGRNVNVGFALFNILNEEEKRRKGEEIFEFVACT
jgi:hypothetical protein